MVEPSKYGGSFYEQRVLAYTAWSEDTAWEYIRENSEMDGKYSVVVKQEN